MSGHNRIALMGMPVDTLSEREAVGLIVGALESGRGGSVITPHLEILRRYRAEPDVRPLFDAADLVLADGQPLVWASRLQGTPLPERVPGSDLVWSLAAECALRGRTVYLLGGAPGVCEAAERRLDSVYPGLRIAGCHSPPLGFEERPEEIAEIRARLRAARPDVVLVALGFPKQERLIAELRGELPAAWFLGVGVSLSFIAGHVARAPDWLMRIGLEWLHRLTQEPRRLFGRYVVHGLPFAARLVAHAAVGRLRRRRSAPAPARPAAAAEAPARVVFHSGALERGRVRELADMLEAASPKR
jgi:N-acetylglucosaminyldiphosphoundecaprenol N-acetyl-beta-D-mannosaminyltransferase